MIRRYLYIFLFLLVLAIPFVLRMAVSSGQDLAAPRGSNRIIILTPHNQDIRREFARAFDAWHRQKFGSEVTLDYRTPGGTNDIKRVLVTSYALDRTADHTLKPEDQIDPPADMVWGGGDFFFDQELKPEGILKPIPVDASLLARVFPNPTLAGVKLLDTSKDKAGRPAPQWIGVCLSSFGIVYNPDLYAALQIPAPRQWADLTSPHLAGFVALADPTHSGSAALAYMMVIQRNMADAEADIVAREPALKKMAKSDLAKNADYNAALGRGWKKGMSELVLIAANARYFTSSSEQVPTDVGNGEAAAGMAIDFYGRVESETVGPERARFVSPVAATAITPDPIAILYGVTGKRLELATHFVEFLLSPQGQRLWILMPGTPGGPSLRSLRRPPIDPALYADQTNWADRVNYFTDAGGFNQRGEWMVLFSDTRPIWSAAWIDSRDALVSAYRIILAVPDPTRRAKLIGELADIPIEMKDVADLRNERKKIEAAQGNSDEWKATQRIEWAKRFRAHYAKVAAEAM